MGVTTDHLERLTPRELEVLRLLCSGLSTYADLTERLCISPNTLHYHLNQLRTKLGCEDSVQLVAFALITGVVSGQELEWRGTETVA